MLYLTIGVLLYSAICLYVYRDILLEKSLTTLSTIYNLASTYYIYVMLLLVPFISLYNTKRTPLVALLVIFAIVFIIRFLISGMIFTDRLIPLYIYKPMKLVYLYLYTPFLILYSFRNLSFENMLMYSGLAFFILLFSRFIYCFIQEKLITTIPKGIVTVLFFSGYIFGAYTFIQYHFIDTDNYFEGNQSVYSYYGNNLISFYEDEDNRYLLDYYYDDQYIYYVVNDSNTSTLKIRDYQTDQVVKEQILDSDALDTYDSNVKNINYQVFNKVGTQLYCFLDDGIYTVDGVNLTKIIDFELDEPEVFYYEDVFYLKNSTKYYKISDNVTETDIFYSMDIDEIKYERLIETNTNDTLRFIDSKNSEGFSDPDNMIIYLTDDYATYFEAIDFGYGRYEIRKVDINGKTVFKGYIEKTVHINEVSYIDSIFSQKSESFSSEYSKYSFDETYSIKGTYKTPFDPNNSDFVSYGSDIKVVNDSLVYVVTSDNRNSDSPFYIEINQLVKTNTDNIKDISIITPNAFVIVIYIIPVLLFDRRRSLKIKTY